MILKQLAHTLHRLFWSSGQPASDVVAATARRLEQQILALVDNMPTLPDTATRALALANEPDSKATDFARLIEADTAIATGILRVANSSLYASGCPATKLHQAVVRLGMWQCQNLILSISMQSLLHAMDDETQTQCAALWHHGYVTAALCRQINRTYRIGFDGEEFSAGLLHDLGRMLVLLADPECFERADGMDFLEAGDVPQRERDLLGIDHGTLGGWFGELSKLPGTLTQVMRFHHTPDQAGELERLASLVAAADHVANYLKRGEAVEAYLPDENAALAALWARWPEARKERLRMELPALMTVALQAAEEQAAA